METQVNVYVKFIIGMMELLLFVKNVTILVIIVKEEIQILIAWTVLLSTLMMDLLRLDK